MREVSKLMLVKDFINSKVKKEKYKKKYNMRHSFF